MSREIISVTIDGESYRELKRAFSSIADKKSVIDFGGGDFYHYNWNLYTEDEALKEMAKKYKSMLDEFTKEKSRYIEILERDIKNLKEQLEK
jgi:hypothetical protein